MSKKRVSVIKSCQADTRFLLLLFFCTDQVADIGTLAGKNFIGKSDVGFCYGGKRDSQMRPPDGFLGSPDRISVGSIHRLRSQGA